jgi:hypothetical protein
MSFKSVETRTDGDYIVLTLFYNRGFIRWLLRKKSKVESFIKHVNDGQWYESHTMERVSSRKSSILWIQYILMLNAKLDLEEDMKKFS